MPTYSELLTIPVLKEKVFSMMSTIESLQSGGNLTEEEIKWAWLEVTRFQIMIAFFTPPDSEDGITARRGIVVAMVKAEKVVEARAILCQFLKTANITPALFEELQLLFLDGRGDK